MAPRRWHFSSKLDRILRYLDPLPPPPPPICEQAFNQSVCHSITGCNWCTSNDGVHELCFWSQKQPATGWKCDEHASLRRLYSARFCAEMKIARRGGSAIQGGHLSGYKIGVAVRPHRPAALSRPGPSYLPPSAQKPICDRFLRLSSFPSKPSKTRRTLCTYLIPL